MADRNGKAAGELSYTMGDGTTLLTLIEPDCFEEPVTVAISPQELEVYRQTGVVSLENVIEVRGLENYAA